MKTTISARRNTVQHDGHAWVIIEETMTAQVLRRPRIAANPALGYVRTIVLKPTGRPGKPPLS